MNLLLNDFTLHQSELLRINFFLTALFSRNKFQKSKNFFWRGPYRGSPCPPLRPIGQAGSIYLGRTTSVVDPGHVTSRYPPKSTRYMGVEIGRKPALTPDCKVYSLHNDRSLPFQPGLPWPVARRYPGLGSPKPCPASSKGPRILLRVPGHAPESLRMTHPGLPESPIARHPSSKAVRCARLYNRL